jgi:hypothetical protein
MRRTTSTIAAAACAVLALGALLSGCARQAQASPKASRLIGTWFDDRSGTQYRFVSDTVVVVPREIPGGGNALTYSLNGTDSIDLVSGGVHRVSLIDELTPDRLVLADPITDDRQLLLRDAGRTTFASELTTAAVEHASVVASLTAPTDIMWVADMPQGKNAGWTEWSPSTLGAYTAAWDWASIKKAKSARIVATGGGANIAFTFTLERKLPTGAELKTKHAALTGPTADTSAEPTAGLKFIDVGYSGSKTEYTAGSIVYLRGGLIYSLGDGYAIPIGLDPKTKSFVPITHD